METHGGADPTVPYKPVADGRGGPLPAIREWLGRWAMRNRCRDLVMRDSPTGVHHLIWSCKGKRGVLQHWKIDGHNHSWPGISSGVDISPVIIKFFDSHVKP